jgi:hypothetical protein
MGCSLLLDNFVVFSVLYGRYPLENLYPLGIFESLEALCHNRSVGLNVSILPLQSNLGTLDLRVINC